MGKYRKRPIIIEAVQYTGRNLEQVISFTQAPEAEQDLIGSDMLIKTLEGNMHVSKNDWIIKGVLGEYYPCKPEIFDATYELAE